MATRVRRGRKPGQVELIGPLVGSPTVVGGVDVCTIVIPWIEAEMLAQSIRDTSRLVAAIERHNAPDVENS